MMMGMAATDRPLVYTIHGPPGVSAAALLGHRAIRILEPDVLLIAEHDDATDAWLECEFGPPLETASQARRARSELA